jgi:hypothetical protein
VGVHGDLQGDARDGHHPDFIVVDGKEGGTGAAPLEFMDHVGMPLRDGLSFVHNALVGIGMRDRIRIGARARSPRPSTWPGCWRWGPTGAMPRAASCSRSAASRRKACHTGECPTGVATQDPYPPARSSWCRTRPNGWQLPAQHAARPGRAGGGSRAFEHPGQFRRQHFFRRLTDHKVASFAELYPQLEPGELLRGTDDPRFKEAWKLARADSFAPA